MDRFLNILASEYVDEIDIDKHVENAIIGILSDLDPHSTYISRDDVKAMNEPLEGNFEGIGVEFNILNDTLMVVNPVPGGPSERVGIVAGDRIIRVGEESTAGVGLKNSDVFRLLRGPKGTKVVVYIQRRGIDNLLEFEIIRDRIPIHSLDAAYMIAPRVGYIKLNRFSLTTEEEFLQALDMLKKQRMKDLILDLSGNGGGFLNAAVSLADNFLDRGRLIVYTEGRSNPRKNFMSTNRGQFLKGNLVIILDEGSASASEIVAGAVQDWDRGIIVGRRSFGKGLVQNQITLPDESMIRLTVARYHTPTGRVIQKPYGFGQADEYYSDLSNRFSKGELFNTDSINMPDSLMYKTLVKGRTVFGGGGIMPDIFVPLDTSSYTSYYGRLVRRGILRQFVISYLDQNRSKYMAQYPNFSVYNSRYSVDNQTLQLLADFAQKSGLEPDPQAMAISSNEISKQVKALIAESLYAKGDYFQVANMDNPTVLKALEVLKNWRSYRHMVAQ